MSLHIGHGQGLDPPVTTGIARVPVMRPRLPAPDAVEARLHSIAESGQYSNFGPQERELRERLAERLGVQPEQVATVSNATLGIAGAVAVLGGKRWLVPSFTFAATPAAVLAAGSDVVFGDVDVDDWALIPTGNVAGGFLPVAPFGAEPEIARWADRERVIHDAAASLGAELDLSNLPAGHAVVFSLHATKVLGAGEGGIVVFGDRATAVRFRAWTNFGFSGSREAQSAGLNAKLSEMQAAYAHAALDGWDEERAEWAAARRFVRAISAELELDAFDATPEGINPYWIVRFMDAPTCNRIENGLAASNVETRRWWARGCHRMPAYRSVMTEGLDTTDSIAGSYLGLPFFRGIEAEVGTRLTSVLRSALQAVSDPQRSSVADSLRLMRRESATVRGA